MKTTMRAEGTLIECYHRCPFTIGETYQNGGTSPAFFSNSKTRAPRAAAHELRNPTRARILLKQGGDYTQAHERQLAVDRQTWKKAASRVGDCLSTPPPRRRARRRRRLAFRDCQNSDRHASLHFVGDAESRLTKLHMLTVLAIAS